MSLKEYAEYGWVLCSIREGEKRPRGDGWNKRENGITEPERAQHLIGAGLCHAFSGTCAIDIDNVDLARVWFRERGIDLDALMKADDAVQIVRGDASHGKLLYALPEPLPWQIGMSRGDHALRVPLRRDDGQHRAGRAPADDPSERQAVRVEI
jgi:hypothetical protein